MPPQSLSGRLRVIRGSIDAAQALAARERDRYVTDRLAVAEEAIWQAFAHLEGESRRRESASDRAAGEQSRA